MKIRSPGGLLGKKKSIGGIPGTMQLKSIELYFGDEVHDRAVNYWQEILEHGMTQRNRKNIIVNQRAIPKETTYIFQNNIPPANWRITAGHTDPQKNSFKWYSNWKLTADILFNHFKNNKSSITIDELYLSNQMQ
jgi:hypothetical protein